MNKEEMNKFTKKLRAKNKEYSPKQIVFTGYSKDKMQQRKIDKKDVVETLLSNKEMYYAEKQNIPYLGKIEERFREIYKISSRYSLIIIVKYEEKVLKVINVIRTSKGAEKLWRKKILK